MAGGATTYGNNPPPGSAPPGYVWSAALGGFVPAGASGHPQSTEAQDTGMDPLGVRQLAEQTREAQANEQLQRDQFTANQNSRASALAALTQLGTTSSGGGGEITLPPAPDTSAADQAAETATLTASKERRGQQLRSGLRGLASQMRGRGIAGSGTEGAGISNFFAAAQGDAADTENQLIQAAAARRHGVSDMTYQAGVNAATQNAAMRQATASQRLQALMQLYGMSY